jgi:4-alpha-glucanotransferase
MRESGILMPIFSLPSKYGIGCFSEEAYEFIRKLKEAGQRKWQVLPLGPTGFGDSPYQSFSTFAGNPYFIDLGPLIDEGLITKEECEALDFGDREDWIDYGKMYYSRLKILDLAHQRFEESEEYKVFVAKNSWWLNDYALFMAIKGRYEGASWDSWDLPYKNREEETMAKAKEELKEQVESYKFQQFYFDRQWQSLRRYANKNGIEIIGDIPIYVAFDSADTWANPKLFQFDENKEPVSVAGCPPDYFSEGGQLWGNPLYDWDYHKETGYEWWFKRMDYTFTLFDMVRIDHFRGFDEYYSIPFGRQDAKVGEWLPGPGIEFFDALKKEFGEQRIIAEDLGLLTDTVTKMLEESGYPGMKVLQFAFDSLWDNDYLPHTYHNNCVVYTGTHDNETTKGWAEGLADETREHIIEYLGREEIFELPEMTWEFIRMAMSSVADLCIIPLQDYLSIGNEGRINTPSTLGGNWTWRLEEQFTPDIIEKIKRMTQLYGR